MSEANEVDGVVMLPCPFCGGKAELCMDAGHYPHKVKCVDCLATAGGSAYENNSLNIGCWNKRAKPKLVNPVSKPIYDDIYFKGVAWLDSQ